MTYPFKATGTLDLGTHAIHCDTCMGMGFVEVTADE